MGIGAVVSAIGTAASVGTSIANQKSANSTTLENQNSVNVTNIQLQHDQQNFNEHMFDKNVDLFTQAGLPGYMAAMGGGMNNPLYDAFPRTSQQVAGNNFSAMSMPGNVMSEYGGNVIQQMTGMANYRVSQRSNINPTSTGTQTPSGSGTMNPRSTFSTQTESNPSGTTMYATPNTPQQLWNQLGGTTPSTSQTVAPTAAVAAPAGGSAMPMEDEDSS